MNKADLVDRIAGACSISKAQATTAIDTAVDSVTAALKKGDRVALIGFGTFSVSQRKARNGRNIEVVGHYNPLTTPAKVHLNHDRIAHWTKSGAQLSDTVARLIEKNPAQAPAA